MASVTVVRVVNFTVYNAFKDIIADNVERVTGFNPLEHYKKPGSTPTVTGILTFTTAGLIAGLVSSPIACMFILVTCTDRRRQTNIETGPFELAKNVVQTSVLVSNRAMAAPDAARDQSLRRKPRLGTIQAIKKIYIRHGFWGLYTGFRLHALRDTVGSGLYFSVYETVKQVAAKELGQDKNPFGAPMIAGAICSTVPWFCVCDQTDTPFCDEHTLTWLIDLPSRYAQDSCAECAARKIK